MLAVVLSFDQFPQRLFGCYGNDLDAMPCLNRIAAESIVFDQHFGEDFSELPAGHAWWSGCYHFPRQGTDQLAEVPTLPDLIGKRNVAADWLTESADPEIVPLPASADFRVLPSFANLMQRGCKILEECRHSEETHRLLWLKVGGKTWDGFSLGEWGSDENDAALSHLDGTIEALWQILLDLAKSRRVLFLLTSARGMSLKNRTGTPESIQTWSEEFVHLPLIVWHSEIAGGERRSEFTQPMDLPATLLDFFANKPSKACEGRSLLTSILNQSENGREFATSGCQGSWEAIRSRGFHFVCTKDPSHPDGFRRLLFIKPGDVWDRYNVASQEPEMTETLSRQVDVFLNAAKNQLPFNTADLDLSVIGDGDDPGEPS